MVLGIGVYWQSFSSSHLGVNALLGLPVQSDAVLHSAFEHATTNNRRSAIMPMYRLILVSIIRRGI